MNFLIKGMKRLKQGNTDFSLLYDALLCLGSREECAAFLDDLCTASEISSINQRLVVAKMLSEGKIYNEISMTTGASTATISRVKRTLESKYSGDGYRIILPRLADSEKEAE